MVASKLGDRPRQEGGTVPQLSLNCPTSTSATVHYRRLARPVSRCLSAFGRRVATMVRSGLPLRIPLGTPAVAKGGAPPVRRAPRKPSQADRSTGRYQSCSNSVGAPRVTTVALCDALTRRDSPGHPISGGSPSTVPRPPGARVPCGERDSLVPRRAG